MRERIKANPWLYKCLYPIVNAGRYLAYYHIPIMFFYLGMFLRKIRLLPRDKNLLKLKDKYRGKRIFVIATGSSVAVEDLEDLEKNGEITISFNSIRSVYPKTNWRPTYYLQTDDQGVETLRMRYGVENYDAFSVDMTVLSKQCGRYLMPEERGERMAYIPFSYQDHWLNHFSKRRSYNRDMSIGAFDLFTVTCSAINLADYMGASEVYLYGLDGYREGNINHVGDTEEKHFDKDDEGTSEAVAHTNRKMMRGYDYLKNTALKDRLPVYNATRGGYLEVFPRVDLDTLIGR